MKKEIEIQKEKKLKLISGLKSWFLDNRDEEIGDLQAELLIDFLTERVGAEIYNQALDDSLYWFKGRLSDLEIDYYSLEKKYDDRHPRPDRKTITQSL